MKTNNFLAILILAITLFACNDDDQVNTSVNNEALFKQAIAIIGGDDLINQSTTISYQSKGISYEFQEDPEPVAGKVADFSYNLIYNLNGSQSKQSWSIQTEYAYESDLNFVETIDVNKGKSEGITGFFSENFGGFGVQGDPMFSTKLAARQKTLFMSSPIAIFKLLMQNTTLEGGDYGVINTTFNSSTLGFGNSTPDIKLVIDPNTKIPLKATVLENDPLLGDVIYEVVYDKWSIVDGLNLPHKLTHILDGNTIRVETLENIQINPNINEGELTVTNSEAWPYDANQAFYGHLSSQFHFRTLMQTFPIDFPVEYVNQTSPLALPSELVANDDNVYRVSGDYQSHYTYAFNIGDGLVLYDSPANNRRSNAVLNKIRSDFSSLPITHVVHSHNHFDHTGGVRGNLAEGGNLVVGSGSKTFMEEVLQREHTVLPNPLNTNVNVIGLENEMTLGTGDNQIVLYTIPTEHAEDDDYIVIYKPSTSTLYFNDLYNPGFMFVFNGLSTSNQERLIRLARDVVNFVDDNNLTVNTYHCSHGFTTSDFDFQLVRDLAAM